MTQQRPDICFIQGVSYALRNFPLESALADLGLEVLPEAQPPGPDCWRGYVATWAWQGERLYLVAVRRPHDNGPARFGATRKVRHRLVGDAPAPALAPDCARRLRDWLLGPQSAPLAVQWPEAPICL